AKVESELKLLMDRWEQQRKELQETAFSSEPHSLAEAVVRGKKPPPLTAEVLQKIRDLAELHARVNGPKPQDKDKAQWQMDRDAFLKQFEKTPFDLAWTVFQVAADESNPRLERVRFWADLLRSAKPLVKFAETDFVVRIEKLSADGAEWP